MAHHDLSDLFVRERAIKQLKDLLKSWRRKQARGRPVTRKIYETPVMAVECAIQALGADPDATD